MATSENRTLHRLIRGALILTGVALVVLVTTGVAIGATVATSVARDGLITIQVDEKGPGGTHISVPVPATLVSLGLGIAKTVAPELQDELAAARLEAEPWLPAARQMLTALEDAPSATLVEVHTEDTWVRVTKKGRQLIVDVDDPETRVHIAVPVDLAGAVLDSLFG